MNAKTVAVNKTALLVVAMFVMSALALAVVALALGPRPAEAQTSQPSGTVVAWGDNGLGQTRVPAGLDGVKAVVASREHSLALKEDGTVVAWGDNGFGQTNVPQNLSGVAAIAAGAYHNLALKNNGTVVAWGANFNGQASVPQNLSDVTAISAGGSHSLVLKDGTVVGWGNNDSGQISVPSGLDVQAISAGFAHSVVLVVPIAPGAVEFFGAFAKDKEASLSWQNPADKDFAAVRILRSTTGAATSPEPNADQTQVYEGTGESFTDTGLENGTTYYYTAYARDLAGNWSTRSVARAAPVISPPSATTGTVSDLAPGAATLHASVNPKGSETTYHFEYGTDSSYGQNTTDQSAGVGMGARLVRADIGGLEPDTTYHYRIVAANSGGSATREDQTFTTPAAPPPNNLPTAQDDSYTTPEDKPLVVEGPGVLANDTDPDGDTLTAVKASDPSHGTLSLQPNGFFLYTPNKDFNGQDSFTYRASDGTDQSAATTVNITVTPVAEPPAPNTAPGIALLTPRPGAQIYDRTPTIKVKVTDKEINLAKSNVRMWVDGKRVKEFSYDRATDRLTYTTKKLGYGRHMILIVAKDEQRLSASRPWGFRIAKR